MIHARPTTEYAADAELFQFQRLEKRVLRAIGNFNRRNRSKKYTWLSKFLTCTVT
jgi:hypothetical protein